MSDAKDTTSAKEPKEAKCPRLVFQFLEDRPNTPRSFPLFHQVYNPVTREQSFADIFQMNSALQVVIPEDHPRYDIVVANMKKAIKKKGWKVTTGAKEGILPTELMPKDDKTKLREKVVELASVHQEQKETRNENADLQDKLDVAEAKLAAALAKK